MDRHGWKPFLQRWSDEWRITNPPDDPAAPSWLGFDPASEAQVAALEARLGRVLPPSLREFLLVSNGWTYAGPFVWRLRDTEELGWLRDLEPHATDDDGDDLLARSLLVSLEADAGMVFLDPDDVDEHGEWAAYDEFSWTAMGPVRHASFYAKMYDFYAGFHSLDRPDCETRREWDARIEQARLAILAGELDGPRAVLEEAAHFGRDRADLLLYQLRTMLGDHHDDTGHHVERPLSGSAAWEPDPVLLSGEILPVLLAEHERTPRWRVSTLDGLRQRGADLVRELIGQAGRAPLRYGVPEFDAAVRAVDWSAASAWPRLKEALALWRPLTNDHVAPVSLLADPRIAPLITPERGREILTSCRGTGR
ncbi:SMI1/KNR4 family protein [Nonomuraea sp. SBT364]|uniref:SMI1/KNR4 family protein n=1 Tax=Nonomuraea sp. SBT364 TaxID=1580530 RepID=UPI00066B17A6|nr:SMI1/KNR4 family protein [Nonomuraea sp. SBT364]